jgi:AraC-like DNA-binding protein
LDKRVEKIIQMMREDVRNELSLSEFAQAVNMSVWRLCHIFKVDVGVTPIRYLRLLRMERAKIRFPNKLDVLTVHATLIAETGGVSGLRDEGLFESALAAAENRHRYEAADVVSCAAAYAKLSRDQVEQRLRERVLPKQKAGKS